MYTVPILEVKFNSLLTLTNFDYFVFFAFFITQEFEYQKQMKEKHI